MLINLTDEYHQSNLFDTNGINLVCLRNPSDKKKAHTTVVV